MYVCVAHVDLCMSCRVCLGLYDSDLELKNAEQRVEMISLGDQQ